MLGTAPLGTIPLGAERPVAAASGGVTVAARWNPSDVNANAVLTNSNTSLGEATGSGTARSVGYESTGQKYFELVCSSRVIAGLANVSESIASFPGATGSNSIGYNTLNGVIQVNGATVATGATAALGDILGIYVDFGISTPGKVWFYKNNVQTGSTGTPGSSGGLSLPSGALAIMATNQSSTSTTDIQPTTTYTPVTGFTGWGNTPPTGVDHLAATAAGIATGTANLDLQHHLAAAAASIASATANLDLKHHLSAAASSVATAFAALDVQSAGTSHLAASAAGAATASAALRVQHHLAAATSALAFASASMDVQHHLAAAASSVAAASAALTTLSAGSHLAADAHSVSSATAALDIIRAPVPNQIRSAIARQRLMTAPYM